MILREFLYGPDHPFSPWFMQMQSPPTNPQMPPPTAPSKS
jgi:hypothetical protein